MSDPADMSQTPSKPVDYSRYGQTDPARAEALREALEDMIDLVQNLVKHQGAKLYAAGVGRVEDARAALQGNTPEAPAEPAFYQARRRNRFNGEWSAWAECPADMRATVDRESVGDEWEVRALYAGAAPAEPPECPACKGSGTMTATVGEGPDGWPQDFDCDKCGGTGAAPAEPDPIADTPTPKPQEGEWMLIAPDGRSWVADSPLHCARAEQRERIPAQVALARIFREVDRG